VRKCHHAEIESFHNVVYQLTADWLSAFLNPPIGHHRPCLCPPSAGGWTPVVKHEIVLQHRRNPDDHSGMLPSGEKKRKRTSIAAPEKRSLEAYFAVQPRYFGQPIDYVEKCRAVLNRDFVTILRGALMQYVTKSETPAPPPPNYNIMYPLEAPVWPV
jgi:hypothetical protein